MYKVFFGNRYILLNTFCPKDNFFSDWILEQPDAKKIEHAINKFKSQLHVPYACFVHEDVEWLKETFFSNFKIIEAAGGLVRNQKNEFLLISRHQMWDLPKGKVDPGESIEEAAIREVTEECGVQNLILKDKIITTYHTFHKKGTPALKPTHWFHMNFKGNETLVPQLEESITEARWMSVEQVETEVFKNTYSSIAEVLNAGI